MRRFVPLLICLMLSSQAEAGIFGTIRTHLATNPTVPSFGKPSVEFGPGEKLQQLWRGTGNILLQACRIAEGNELITFSHNGFNFPIALRYIPELRWICSLHDSWRVFNRIISYGAVERSLDLFTRYTSDALSVGLSALASGTGMDTWAGVIDEFNTQINDGYQEYWKRIRNIIWDTYQENRRQRRDLFESFSEDAQTRAIQKVANELQKMSMPTALQPMVEFAQVAQMEEELKIVAAQRSSLAEAENALRTNRETFERNITDLEGIDVNSLQEILSGQSGNMQRENLRQIEQRLRQAPDTRSAIEAVGMAILQSTRAQIYSDKAIRDMLELSVAQTMQTNNLLMEQMRRRGRQAINLEEQLRRDFERVASELYIQEYGIRLGENAVIGVVEFLTQVQ